MNKGTITCPKCETELFTDGSYLSTFSMGAPSDKPDPHVVTKEPQAEDDDIMKAAESRIWVDSAIAINSPVAVQIRIFAQAIAAKIEDVRLGRKLYTPELEPKISALETEIKGLKRREALRAQIAGALERKVESLELNQKELIKDATKPQPKGGVALDKEGMPHDLIPGVSVYYLRPKGYQKIFHHYRDGRTYGYPVWPEEGIIHPETWADPIEQVIWLRNLSFPGGDK